MPCSRIAHTGVPSDLFQQLYEILGNNEEKAEGAYLYVSSFEFMNKFGNYLHDLSEIGSKRLDDNGEPKLFYDETIGKHYFIAKDGSPIYHPFAKTRLQEVFSVNQIKELAKSMALNFYADHISFNFDSLELTSDEVSLEKYIESFITDLATQMINSDDFMLKMKVAPLLSTKQDAKEWKQRVLEVFEALKITSQTNVQDELEIEEDTPRAELMRTESFLKNSKDNASSNIKLLLSLFESNQKNSFGLNTFLSFDEVYANLNYALANTVAPIGSDPYDMYLDKIRAIYRHKPYFSKLVEYLTSDQITDTFKNQFVSAFDLHKNDYSNAVITKDNKTGDISYDVRNISEISSRKAAITGQWYSNFVNKKISGKAQADLIDGLKKAKALVMGNRLVEAKDVLKSQFDTMGVAFSNEAYSFYIDNYANEDEKAGLSKLIESTLYGVEAHKKDVEYQLFRQQAALKDLAASVAFFYTEGSDASVYTHGKTKWVFSYPSYISKMIELWKINPQALKDRFQATAYNNTSYYMAELLDPDSGVRLDDMMVMVFDTANDLDGSDISEIDMVIDFLNKTLMHRKGGKSLHKTALAADKSTQYEIHYGNLNVNANMDQRERPSEQVLDIMFNYLRGEYERIGEVLDEITIGVDLIKDYHIGRENGKKIHLFPEFNGDPELFDENGVPLYEDLTQVEAVVKDKLANIIIARVEKLQGILKKERINSKETIDSQIFDSYSGQKLRGIAGDLWANSTIAQVEYSKMFSGDVAFYKDNLDYKKRIPGTYSDGLYITQRDEKGNVETHFNAAVISSVEVPSKYLEQLEKMLGKEIASKYASVNVADAQAWITPLRWKNIMKGMGKWSSERDALYEKLISTSDYVEFSPEELRFLAQPLKGVHFELRDNYAPTYLKYSQAVLLPRLVKGTPLEDILKHMVSNEIDELITEDGVKAGATNITTIHDSNGDIDLSALQGLTPMKLENRLWKLQQDLPTKGVKSRPIGSQIQKNIFQGLVYNLETKFDVEGDVLTGDQLIDEINKLFKELTIEGINSIKAEFGIDVNGNITNEKTVYNAIIKMLKERGDSSDNLIQALEKGLSPYGIPGYSEIFQNMFASLFKKRIVQLESEGAGLIQMSDFGLNFDEASDITGIKLAPWFEEKSLPPPLPDENGKIQPGGIFLSGSVIAPYIPDWKSMSSEELFSKIDEKILKNIIGYRIPNQSLASNDALQVMGILPEGMGDTIIPYVGITKKTGSDYDIDKMYIMMPSFEEKGGKLKYISYKEGGGKKGIQNRIIEIYKSILTHPDVIKLVMDPIDIDFIENDIKDLLPPAEDINPFDSYADIALKKVYQQGKAGLGQNVNSLVDVARGAMADLRLENTSIEDLKPSEDDNFKLDNEFSYLLKPHEIKEYEKTFALEGVDPNTQEKIALFTSHMAYVNGFVDIAKDDYVVRGNWTRMTNPVGFMLLRAGLHPYRVNAFMAQPVLREFAKFSDSVGSLANPSSLNKSKQYEAYKIKKIQDLLLEDERFSGLAEIEEIVSLFDEKFTSEFFTASKSEKADAVKQLFESGPLRRKIDNKFKGAPVAQIFEEVQKLFEDVYIAPSYVKSLPFGELRVAARESSVNRDNLVQQMSQLNAMQYYDSAASAVNKGVQASKIDVEGIGRNIASFFVKKNLFDFVLYEQNPESDEPVVTGFDTKLTRKGADTMLGATKKAVIDFLGHVIHKNPKFFISGSQNVYATFNFISQHLTGTNLMDEQLAQELQKAYHTYLLSGYFSVPTAERIDLMQNLPSELENIKKQYPDNLLLKELYTNKGEIEMTSVRKTVSYKNDLIDAWRELDEHFPEFSKKLMKYSFVKDGFQKGIKAFHEYIPHEFIDATDFNRFVDTLITQGQEVDLKFVEQFFRNKITSDPNFNIPKVGRFTGPTNDKGGIHGFLSKKNSFILRRPSDFGNSYYMKVGLHEESKMNAYVRTSALNGNEYNMTEENLISVNKKHHVRVPKPGIIKEIRDLGEMILYDTLWGVESTIAEDIDEAFKC